VPSYYLWSHGQVAVHRTFSLNTIGATMLFPRHYERDVLTVDFFPEKIPFPSSPPTLSQTVNRDMLHLLTTSAPSTPLPTRAFGPPILNADEKLLISFNDTSSSASSGGAGFLSSFPQKVPGITTVVPPHQACLQLFSSTPPLPPLSRSCPARFSTSRASSLSRH
jgi:hypothetical protein